MSRTSPPASTSAPGVDVDEGLDRLLATASVLLVVGTGGVGKTTITAALGSRAVAVHERRVLVVTIDPARRLAEALGLEATPHEPVLVPAGGGAGRLWALMVDMSRSWDALINRLAPADEAEALLANPLYRGLTTRFVQSHDYIALDHLCDLTDDDRYDLVIVDTPPANHAIEVLDAPDRMIAFFDSRLLRWLTAPYRSGLAQATAKPFLAIAERLLGGQFLAAIGEFFWLFSRLQPGFVRRAEEVRRRLDDPTTRYAVVTTSDPASVARTEELLDELDARGHPPSIVIHNRAIPTPSSAVAGAGAGAEARPGGEGGGAADDGAGVGAEVVDPTLRAAMASLVGRDRHLLDALARRGSGQVEVATIAWSDADLTSVPALIDLLD